MEIIYRKSNDIFMKVCESIKTQEADKPIKEIKLTNKEWKEFLADAFPWEENTSNVNHVIFNGVMIKSTAKSSIVGICKVIEFNNYVKE